MEFFATDDVNDPENFTFVSRERRQICLVELAWRLDLYNQSVATSPEFVVFLEHFYKRLPAEVTENGYWTKIANGSYTGGIPNEGKIRKVVHRFIHQLITFSINQKKEED